MQQGHTQLPGRAWPAPVLDQRWCAWRRCTRHHHSSGGHTHNIWQEYTVYRWVDHGSKICRMYTCLAQHSLTSQFEQLHLGEASSVCCAFRSPFMCCAFCVLGAYTGHHARSAEQQILMLWHVSIAATPPSDYNIAVPHVHWSSEHADAHFFCDS